MNLLYEINPKILGYIQSPLVFPLDIPAELEFIVFKQKNQTKTKESLCEDSDSSEN